MGDAPGKALKTTLDEGGLEFARQFVPDITSVSFCGWDHAESGVWELSTKTGRVFLKQHRQTRKLEQELHAYQAWTPHLSPLTPKLLAHQRETQTLLLSAVPGELVERVKLSTREESDLHRQAGAFLLRLHDVPFEDADPLTLAEALEKRLEAWAARAQGVLTLEDIAWVRARVAEALPLLEGLTRVPCHRDYTARNWLAEGNTLYVIDFEHARPDGWLFDLERLWAALWPERPDLRAAFLDGYGRYLGEEEGVLERCAALGALSTIVWARDHKDTEFEKQGWRHLAWLKAQS